MNDCLTGKERMRSGDVGKKSEIVNILAHVAHRYVEVCRASVRKIRMKDNTRSVLEVTLAASFMENFSFPPSFKLINGIFLLSRLQ